MSALRYLLTFDPPGGNISPIQYEGVAKHLKRWGLKSTADADEASVSNEKARLIL